MRISTQNALSNASRHPQPCRHPSTASAEQPVVTSSHGAGVGLVVDSSEGGEGSISATGLLGNRREGSFRMLTEIREGGFPMG